MSVFNTFLSDMTHVQVKVKMVTSDDNATTDIIIEGDVEEISRFQKVRSFLLIYRIYSHT